jgi:hypothetical protein
MTAIMIIAGFVLLLVLLATIGNSKRVGDLEETVENLDRIAGDLLLRVAQLEIELELDGSIAPYLGDKDSIN